MLGIGYLDPKKKKSKAKEKEILENILAKLSEELVVKVTGEIIDRVEGGAVAQVDLSSLMEKLPQPEKYGDVLETDPKIDRFKTISSYPFMTRDIAVFVTSEKDRVKLEEIMLSNTGELLAREPRLFDEYRKGSEEGKVKISYAYKLVFQSYERTLTDAEVNKIMEKIYAEIGKNKDWEVR